MHAVQLARLAGAYVIAQTTSPDKAAMLTSLGAHDTVVGARGEDFSGRVRELTDGAGVDVLIDNVGTPLFTAMRRSLAINGRWILIGQLTGDFVAFNPAQLFLRNKAAKSADPKKVAEAMRAMDTTQGAARYFPGGRLKFDPNGRRAGAELVILQWQNGEPKPIFPVSLATTQAVWPKR